MKTNSKNNNEDQIFLYSFRYLKRLRRYLECMLVDPILSYKLYSKNLSQVAEILIRLDKDN